MSVQYSVQMDGDLMMVYVRYNDKYGKKFHLHKETVDKLKDMPTEVLMDLLEVDMPQVVRLYNKRHAERCKAVAELLAAEYVDAECGEPFVFDDFVADDIHSGLTMPVICKGLKSKKITTAQLDAIERFLNDTSKVKRVNENNEN